MRWFLQYDVIEIIFICDFIGKKIGLPCHINLNSRYINDSVSVKLPTVRMECNGRKYCGCRQWNWIYAINHFGTHTPRMRMYNYVSLRTQVTVFDTVLYNVQFTSLWYFGNAFRRLWYLCSYVHFIKETNLSVLKKNTDLRCYI